MRSLISIHALLAESDERTNGLANAPPQISIHALLAESDGIIDIVNNVIDHFYPRSPCGERHDATLHCLRVMRISIHALLAESDPPRVIREPATSRFLSTLSLRRATTPKEEKRWNSTISIHALLAESDNLPGKIIKKEQNFYPRSPCGERLMPLSIVCMSCVFLSTLSLRRATAKVHKTVGHFCAYETNFMEIASSC